MKRSYDVSQSLPDDVKNNVQKELNLGYLNLSEEMFDQAKMNFEIVLQYDKNCADAYWGLMLVKLNLSNEDDLYSDPMKHKCLIDLPEFKQAISNASETQYKLYSSLLERVLQINLGDDY